MAQDVEQPCTPCTKGSKRAPLGSSAIPFASSFCFFLDRVDLGVGGGFRFAVDGRLAGERASSANCASSSASAVT